VRAPAARPGLQCKRKGKEIGGYHTEIFLKYIFLTSREIKGLSFAKSNGQLVKFKTITCSIII
jgi:hypothetical protein